MVFLDDTRWPPTTGEVAIWTSGRGFWYLSGSVIDGAFTGNSPVFSPSGEEVALGKTLWTIDGKDSHRISIFDLATRTRRPLHGGDLAPLYPGMGNLYEGSLALDWSHDGEWLAYSVGLFPSRVWRSRLDGTGVEQLTFRPAAPIDFSPDDSHLLYQHQQEIRSLRLSDRRDLRLSAGFPGTLPWQRLIGYCGDWDPR